MSDNEYRYMLNGVRIVKADDHSKTITLGSTPRAVDLAQPPRLPEGETINVQEVLDSMAVEITVNLNNTDYEQFLKVMGCQLCDRCKSTHNTLRYAVLISTPTLVRGGFAHLCPKCAEALRSIFQEG